MSARVAFLGLGIMGSRMAANLVRAGHDVVAWTRTEGKAEAWAAEHGAAAATTPAEAATGADAVISMVVDGPQVEAVLLGPDGAASGAAPGTLCIDMSTIAPGDARRIAAMLDDRGLRFVDAPVTGSAPKAQDATLTIMAGGTGADVARARPLLEAMGRLVVRVGDVGQGQVVKIINNSVAAANALTVAQALLVADALGADLDALSAVMEAGSGSSTMLELKAGAMRTHAFEPLFKLEHMLKDVRFCLDAAEEAGVPFPAAAAARDALAAAEAEGHATDDFAALVVAAEEAAGRRLDTPSASSE